MPEVGGRGKWGVFAQWVITLQLWKMNKPEASAVNVVLVDNNTELCT